MCTSCVLHLGDGCVLVRIGPPPFSYFISLMSPTQATAHILCSPFSLTGGEFAWRDSIGRGSLCKHFSRDEVASSGGDDPPGWRLGARAFRRWGGRSRGEGRRFRWGHSGRHRFARIFGAKMWEFALGRLSRLPHPFRRSCGYWSFPKFSASVPAETSHLNKTLFSYVLVDETELLITGPAFSDEPPPHLFSVVRDPHRYLASIIHCHSSCEELKIWGSQVLTAKDELIAKNSHMN